MRPPPGSTHSPYTTLFRSKGGWSLTLEVRSELARKSGLAAPLQAHQENDGRWVVGQLDGLHLSPQEGDELVVDYLHHLLSGRKAAEHFPPGGLFANGVEKAPGHQIGRASWRERV